MIPNLDLKLTAREAYEDSDDVPTVVLHGPSEIGPVTIHLKGKGLDLGGVVIGQMVEVAIAGQPSTR